MISTVAQHSFLRRRNHSPPLSRQEVLAIRPLNITDDLCSLGRRVYLTRIVIHLPFHVHVPLGLEVELKQDRIRIHRLEAVIRHRVSLESYVHITS